MIMKQYERSKENSIRGILNKVDPKADAIDLINRCYDLIEEDNGYNAIYHHVIKKCMRFLHMIWFPVSKRERYNNL